MSLPWLGLKLSESSLDFIYNIVNDSAAQASAAKEAEFKASADIIGIRARIMEDKPGILEIEVIFLVLVSFFFY